MCRVRIRKSMMIKLRSPPAPPVLMIFGFFYWVGIFSFVHVAQAQSPAPSPFTDPNEVRALNSIFGQWGISADPNKWNTSGDPCSGAAIDGKIVLADPDYNPFIRCGCSYNTGTLCHIQELKVVALNVVGDIPAELWTLTFLTVLDLHQNSLTGPLSASIGNLTALKFLDFSTNALSGELPKELGMLTDLIVLSMKENYFSGLLPSELGNLTELQELYIASSGVSGEIPLSFANLRNLVEVWAFDIELTGMIPDFIGNWSKLKTLRFQGNSFEGPIPSSFSNLINLTELILRNNHISDVIPSNIGEFQSLKYLDLSFNNISGDIPNSLFNLSSLAYLCLGNNKLNGTLPSQKIPSLDNIDVSYNYLIGSLPSWVNELRLQLNLVANNFTIEKSDSSVLSSKLKCLQRNFPCNRGSGIYYNFSINCGGQQIASSNGIVYESDDAPLGPASYFVTNSSKWGVSNVAFSYDMVRPRYQTDFIDPESEFTNTPDPQLFETTRTSTSSLRYYGLGLENGIYTVTLQFTESIILDNTTRQRHGTRVFDIYVQGNLVSKDFDIKREAGGVSKRAVKRKFKAHVSENYLEIHLFWAGKGTCCIPRQGTYGPTISAISATLERNRSIGLIMETVRGVGLLIFLFLIAIFCNFYRRNKSNSNDDDEFADFQGIDTRPHTFSYAELKTATGDFSPTNKLGEGGFGPVYKGTLSDGRVIAVKQLSLASRQGKSQFVAEIIVISAVQHRNLVKLYGCCIKGIERLLVYEYMENKSLDQALFGQKSLNLNWTTRYDICLGVARGLTYLHEESRLRIIHRDIKASNILLDLDFIPKISDFGLARLYDDNKTHISTRVAGTIGYVSPEYAMRGHLSEKTDVFAFGVMALEIISGKPNSDSSFDEEQLYLLEWAWQLYENNREVELVDSRLSEFNEEEVERMIGVALLCTQTLPSMRPTMSRAVAMLCGDIEVSKATTKPGYLTDWKFDDITSFATDDETTKGTASYYTASSTNMVAEAHHSAENCSRPILHDNM